MFEYKIELINTAKTKPPKIEASTQIPTRRSILSTRATRGSIPLSAIVASSCLPR